MRLSAGQATGAHLFVFDAGYDPVKLQQGLEGCWAQILVRLRAGRRFYAEPRRSACPNWTAASARTEDEVLGTEHLARTLYGVRMRGLWLRDRASVRLGEVASEGLLT